MITENEAKAKDTQSFYHVENGLRVKLDQNPINAFSFAVWRLLLEERESCFHWDVQKRSISLSAQIQKFALHFPE